MNPQMPATSYVQTQCPRWGAAAWGHPQMQIGCPTCGQAIGPVGSDFLAFWGAGQVTAAGHPAQAYDLAVQQQVHRRAHHRSICRRPR